MTCQVGSVEASEQKQEQRRHETQHRGVAVKSPESRSRRFSQDTFTPSPPLLKQAQQ